MQHSYGIVVFLKNNSSYKALLVQHHSGYRSFPKGHIEAYETPLQTARREVLEEIGLSDVHIIPNLYFDHYYSFFDKDGVLIDKKVGFFVGEVYDDSIVLQKTELKNYCWKDFDAALLTLTFDSDKNILKKSYSNIVSVN